VEFRVLGPVEARGDDGTIDVGGPKQRALLAILLLHANEAVPRDRLIEGLWGERPPASASHTLNDYVSRLRKVLADGRLKLQPPGYVLRVESGELDLDRFRQLAAEGELAIRDGRAAEAARLLEEALSLCRDTPLTNASMDGVLNAEAARLDELRLSVLEQRIDTDLALGRHRRLVGELERLVRRYPLHEGFRAQLMLALYRSGRQADALALYAETRSMLVEELGLEPGRSSAICSAESSLRTRGSRCRPEPWRTTIQSRVALSHDDAGGSDRCCLPLRCCRSWRRSRPSLRPTGVPGRAASSLTRSRSSTPARGSCAAT
jgi:DNA-binding SARP family transcriptional activator